MHDRYQSDDSDDPEKKNALGFSHRRIQRQRVAAKIGLVIGGKRCWPDQVRR
jgi:hypothetical protein